MSRRYLKGRRAFLLAIEKGPKSPVDTMFQVFKDMDKLITHTPRPQWMLDISLRLIDVRADHRHQPDHNRNVPQNLTKAVRKSLVANKRRISEVASDEIGTCLETPHGTP